MAFVLSSVGVPHAHSVSLPRTAAPPAALCSLHAKGSEPRSRRRTGDSTQLKRDKEGIGLFIDINFHAEAGTLTIVVGEVGCDNTRVLCYVSESLSMYVRV